MVITMNQSRNILNALILVGLCFFKASGKLRQRHLEENCQDLPIGLSEDENNFYSFSENTRCLLAGGKYCTATKTSPQKGYFKYVGQGCCIDWSSNLFDYVYYAGPFTVDQCGASCSLAMDQLGSQLRGFSRGSTDEISDCYCFFDDGAISNVPDGGTSADDDYTGTGEVKATNTDWWTCSINNGECYRYLSRECPSSTNPTADDSFTKVGGGCCVNRDDLLYDFVYYADKLTKEECESKCISAMRDINSTLQGIQRDSIEDKSNCYCLFDDGVLTRVPNCASAVRDDLSGVGQVQTISTAWWECYAVDGECYRYSSTKRALESKSNDSSENFLTTCMSQECDAAHAFFINGTMVDANAVLKDVNCMVSSCKTFEIGINRPFNDIAQVPSTDPSDCCDACHKEPGCMLFSWSKSQSLCYLKNSQGSTADDQDYITGYI